MKQREHWSGSLGFILAATGSAIGLGNLWKFPYITYKNNGGTFVLVYLACVALVGLPLMIAEFLIGQRGQGNCVVSFENLGAETKGGKSWGLIGWLGVFFAFVILAFYTVIAGWSLSSFFQCLKWSFLGYEAPASTAFGEFLTNVPLQLLLTALFSLFTAWIVIKGISHGIEKTTKVMMPLLFIIMLVLVFNSMRMPGFGESLSFLFSPGKITTHGVLEALGHSFFTLSLGMGAMVTYGSYMKKTESITRTALIIVIFDTLIALLACVVMYTIIFSFPEVKETIGKSTVGMLFVTMPIMFYTKLPGGVVIGPLFYVLVAFAALTSTISLMEVIVSMFVDKENVTRKKATIVGTGIIFMGSIFCILSLGASEFWSHLKFFGQAESGLGHRLNEIIFANKSGFLNLLDHLSTNWLMPIGGFFTVVFVGWFVSHKIIKEELQIEGKRGILIKFSYYAFLLLTRIVAPLAILYIIYKVIVGTDFS